LGLNFYHKQKKIMKKNIFFESLFKTWNDKCRNYFLSFLFIVVSTSAVAFLWKTINGMKFEEKNLNNWFDILGNFSQFLLVILGCFVLKQIQIAKNDLKIRCTRESVLRSVELSDMFAREIIPEISKFQRGTIDSNYKFANRELKDYYEEEIIKLGLEEEKKYELDIAFLNKNHELNKRCISILNSFEALSINFTKGVADESSVFTALSQVYCEFIRENSSFICFLRGKKLNIFTNMIELYKVWSNRISANGLLLQDKRIQERLAEFNNGNDKIKPIGT